MKIKDKDYFTTREAAELLNVAVSTIQSWTDDGILQAWITAGGHRRITKVSVEGLLSKDKDISIVVIEGNEQDRTLYEEHFNIWDLSHNVSICKNGYAGLIHIGQQSPKVIITDLMMPSMNGFEMIRAIKEETELENCLIIVVSALTTDEINIRGGLPPEIHVLTKPLLFTDLENLIKQQFNLNIS